MSVKQIIWRVYCNSLFGQKYSAIFGKTIYILVLKGNLLLLCRWCSGYIVHCVVLVFVIALALAHAHA